MEQNQISHKISGRAFFDDTPDDDKGILRAKEVLTPDWIEEYERLRQEIWDQLIRLDLHLYYIDRIQAFPFHVFEDRRSAFWQMTKSAFIESSIMAIWHLAGNNKILSLGGFRTEIIKNIVDETTKIKVRSRLRGKSFEKKRKALLDSIDNIRNEFLAHRDYDRIINPENASNKDILVTLDDLKGLSNDLQSFFHILCFENYHVVQAFGYDERARDRHDTDIDTLLDLVAKNYHLTNMPERQPEIWRQIRERMQEENPEKLEVILSYRRKFGMDEA